MAFIVGVALAKSHFILTIPYGIFFMHKRPSYYQYKNDCNRQLVIEKQEHEGLSIYTNKSWNWTYCLAER